jgi:hypothetical protein
MPAMSKHASGSSQEEACKAARLKELRNSRDFRCKYCICAKDKKHNLDGKFFPEAPYKHEEFYMSKVNMEDTLVRKLLELDSTGNATCKKCRWGMEEAVKRYHAFKDARARKDSGDVENVAPAKKKKSGGLADTTIPPKRANSALPFSKVRSHVHRHMAEQVVCQPVGTRQGAAPPPSKWVQRPNTDGARVSVPIADYEKLIKSHAELTRGNKQTSTCKRADCTGDLSALQRTAQCCPPVSTPSHFHHTRVWGSRCPARTHAASLLCCTQARCST